VRLLLLAPPGAGKGTQGERLAAKSGVRHIAAGDLLRAEAQAGTGAGREIASYQARGDLVPDQIVLDTLTPAVVEAAAGGGYILDGFPRTLGGRADDVADVIQYRHRVFAETTGPLVRYYTERGILVAVDADQPPDSVTAGIQDRLSGLRLTRLHGHEGGARL
jgi:adenylate kinase